MKLTLKIAIATGAFLALAGCANTNVFKDNEPTPVEPALAAEPALDAAPLVFDAVGIRNTIAGKSFRWRGPNNSGTTLFAADGTSLIEVDGKGTTTGKWVAKDGQLCESISPGPVLKNGSRLRCNSFSGGNGTFKVGAATFTPS
jgi:hypothetical protein